MHRLYLDQADRMRDVMMIAWCCGCPMKNAMMHDIGITLEQAEEMLDQCIKMEQYEMAAELRDHIEELRMRSEK